MFGEPLSGFRQATARARRTKQDWALEVAQLLDGRYAGSAKVTLVCDNLNTHTKGAFYEALSAFNLLAAGLVYLMTPRRGKQKPGLGQNHSRWNMGKVNRIAGFTGIVLGAWAVALMVSAPADAASEKAAKKKAPQVEVVFCLDTTGSMTGLIEGAKQKIWSISNQIASGKPTPGLKIGLVAYRDRGDAYVTKVIDLTDDLDAIHGHLQGFKAEAGGDFPESVNQALNESVTRIKWSTDKDTLRIIFLVGDAPPHMDYKDDVKYPVTCKLAQELGIIVNAVQCGDHPETRMFWEDICKKAGGSYVQIAANGGVVAIATPFDKELARINGELARTTLVYGDRSLQLRGEMKKDAAAKLPASSAAERASFAGKTGGVATYDLLDSIKAKKVKLADIKKEHLPPELQKLSAKEQKAYLQKLAARRAELTKQILDLDKKKAAYIKEKFAGDKKKKDGFDEQVLLILRQQAKKASIEFKD